MQSANQTVDLFLETLPVAVTEHGEGRTFLVLHGGAGPASVSGLADALSRNGRVIVPTHPGFNAQPRPQWFRRVDDLALAYLALLERLNAEQVVLVGNSLGGWIAAEMALRHSPRIAGLVLINAIGIDAGESERPIVNPLSVSPAERAELAFHDPQRFGIMPATPEAQTMVAANQQALMVYAGDPYAHDPALRQRLASIATPTLVIWGESDRIVDVSYGRRYARSIPDARFEAVAAAGHFPHIEQLNTVLTLIEHWNR